MLSCTHRNKLMKWEDWVCERQMENIRMTMHLITALMFAPCDVQLWITLKIMFNCVHKQRGSLSHVVRFYGDVVRIHDMWIVLRERERECMKKSYVCSQYKREQHIQLWHTKQNEMYIGRSEAQKKRKKYTSDGHWPSQCTCFSLAYQ